MQAGVFEQKVGGLDAYILWLLTSCQREIIPSESRVCSLNVPHSVRGSRFRYCGAFSCSG